MDDPPFLDILSQMRWGVLTAEDVLSFNEQAVTPNAILAAVPPMTGYFAPVVTAANTERCAVNRKLIRDTCQSLDITCYQVMAEPSRQKHIQRLSQISFLNDDATSKVPLLFQFYLGMAIMVTKRIPALECLKVFANGTLGHIVGFVSSAGEHFSTTFADGVTVKQFQKMPKLIWVKIRGCNRVLVNGCPSGVVGLPPSTLSVSIKMPNSNATWSPTLTQFCCIPALACTPEKLQGVTLEHSITIGKLDRHPFKTQTLYVSFSRVRAKTAIRLPWRLTMAYVRLFRPPKIFILEMIRLIALVELPIYADDAVTQSFTDWKLTQNEFAAKALLKL